LSPNPPKNVTENQHAAVWATLKDVIEYNSGMNSNESTPGKSKFQLVNLGGKNRRFYASALIMLLLILAPFGLYAALHYGNDILAGILFAIITGCMLLMLFVA